jgi:hypothetical protein
MNPKFSSISCSVLSKGVKKCRSQETKERLLTRSFYDCAIIAIEAAPFFLAVAGECTGLELSHLLLLLDYFSSVTEVSLSTQTVPTEQGY